MLERMLEEKNRNEMDMHLKKLEDDGKKTDEVASLMRKLQQETEEKWARFFCLFVVLCVFFAVLRWRPDLLSPASLRPPHLLLLPAATSRMPCVKWRSNSAGSWKIK